jgi:hypothetical protein
MSDSGNLVRARRARYLGGAGRVLSSLTCKVVQQLAAHIADFAQA